MWLLLSGQGVPGSQDQAQGEEVQQRWWRSDEDSG